MLTICTFRWRPFAGYRSVYPPETVNVLRNMVRRHYRSPHRFVCITDDPTGIDPAIEIVPLWGDYAQIPNPFGAKNPSCYRRLKIYDPAIADILGPRFVHLDLDCVITGDLAPLWDRDEDFVIYGDTNPKTYYNGSLVLMNAGARAKVWKDFDPLRSPRQTKSAGFYGSDQAWISYCLGPGEKRWTSKDGVYSFRNEIKPKGMGVLPSNARLVVFHGAVDPWEPYAKTHCPWVREHYC